MHSMTPPSTTYQWQLHAAITFDDAAAWFNVLTGRVTSCEDVQPLDRWREFPVADRIVS